MENILRYSNQDLAEFRTLIQHKRNIASEELDNLRSSLNYKNPNGTDDTAGANNTLEDGPAALDKEYLHELAVKQQKFVEQLDAALKRIENGTYGICRATGKLIQKERLLAVPHTTLSMEAKQKQNAA